MSINGDGRIIQETQSLTEHGWTETNTHEHPRRFWKGLGLGILCALIWGVQAVVSRRSVLDGLSAADVTILRFLVAGAVLLPVALGVRPIIVGELGSRRALALTVLAGAPYTLLLVRTRALAPALHHHRS